MYILRLLGIKNTVISRMSQQNSKCQYLEKQHQEEEKNENSLSVEVNCENLEMIQAPGNAISSNQEGNGTTTSTIGGHGNGNDVNELEITHLKAKVQMLEMEKQQLSEKWASLEKQYKKEIAELKVKLAEQNASILPQGRRLPLEMECEIFKYLKWPIQRKFIWGMGTGIYRMFGQQLLIKTIGVRRPKQNRWRTNNAKIAISPNVLQASGTRMQRWGSVFAREKFTLSVEHCRKDNLASRILYYFEVTITAFSLKFQLDIGFSDTLPDDDGHVGYGNLNHYCVANTLIGCWLSDDDGVFEYSPGVIVPKFSQNAGDTVGCDILLNSKNEWAIFFTLNGISMGKQLPINLFVDHLFPTVCMRNFTLEAIEILFVHFIFSIVSLLVSVISQSFLTCLTSWR